MSFPPKYSLSPIRICEYIPALFIIFLLTVSWQSLAFADAKKADDKPVIETAKPDTLQTQPLEKDETKHPDKELTSTAEEKVEPNPDKELTSTAEEKVEPNPDEDNIELGIDETGEGDIESQEIAEQNDEEVEYTPEPVNSEYLTDNSLEMFEAEFYNLQDKIASFSRTADDYEELYSRMRPVIAEKTRQLHERIKHKNVDLKLLTQVKNDEEFIKLLSLTREIKNFYLLRHNIFVEATDEFRSLLTSTKLNGINEAKLEFDYISLQMLIIFKATFQRVIEVPERFSSAPVDIFINIVMIFFAFVVLKKWQSWAKTGLPIWRQKILATRPRTAARMKAARAIWYLENTRTPIEWLLFINFILSSIDILQIQILIDVISTLALWICLTYFVFSFLSKMIERGKQGVLKNISSKQSKSLKLAVWWVGWYKLSFELTAIFIANGTIFSWLETLFLFLLLPVYIFFILQWRNDCFNYIDEERDAPAMIKKLITERTGIKGFFFANIALIFVVYFFFTKVFLSLISRVESGRRITAEIYRKKLVNDNTELLEKTKSAANLYPELHDILIDSDKSNIDSVFQGPISKVINMLENNERSHLAVTGERGIGKSHFLKSLAKQHGKAIIINCNEDFGDLLNSMQEQLGLEQENVKTSDITKAIKEQGIDLILLDNCHRFLTSEASGQREIRRLYGWINDLKGLALWVLSFDSSSWSLLNALGIATGFFSTSIQLKTWTEDQISALFEQRCKEAELDIDFGQLIIPRQLADIEHDSMEARNKSGIYRIIWGYADGNPAIACRTFANSIIFNEGRLMAILPAYPDNKIIEHYDINSLLVLRVLCQFGRCSVNDIVKNLRLNGLVVNSALSACVAQGIVEQVSGRYQITWLWFRSVSKYLARQNLLTR
ncbi:AAA family ATPase [Thalassotalea psychrophila]|uniref:AAA family ATPase n=1 Tax=Thalassotalea psychrophila TaxID=3065647 RepID=A0ABY9TTP6_9GAMM|nr:AAA family ATPase [Colwelliaceae bacterium SQ149]